MKFVRVLTAGLLLAAVIAVGVSPAQARTSNSRSVSRSQLVLLNSASGRSLQSTPSNPASDTASVSATSAPIATGRILVRLKGSSAPSALDSVAKSVHTTRSGISDVRHGRLEWGVPKGRSAEAFAKELVDSGKVEYAVPDYARQLVGYTPPSYSSPNDPFFTDTQTSRGYSDVSLTHLIELYPSAASWWLRDVQAPQAWAEGYTGPSIVGKYPLRASGSAFTVAVLDAGLYSTHPDVGVTITGGRDFFDHQDSNFPYSLVQDNDVTPVDPNVMPPSMGTLDERQHIASHGTCVAGEIGATVNNSIAGVGVGYDTQVVVHKVMGIYRNGAVAIDDGAVVDAIMYSVDNGAKVISMSFGGYQYSQAFVDAINYATSHGVVVVAAKGNDASGDPFYPGDNAGVISVGALDKNANAASVPASFTNYRKTSLDVMAPGSFVLGLYNPDVSTPDPTLAPDGYAIWDGTSMATPIVAGAVAWLWRAAPALSASEITNEVLGSATKHGAATHFPSGWREINMYAAYKKLEADYPLLVKPTLADQTVASVGTVRVFWAHAQSKPRGVTFASADDTSTSSTTSTMWQDFAMAPGDHVVSVAAHSDFNWDDGTAVATATIHVLAAAEGTSSMSAHLAGSTSTLAIPSYGQAVAIDTDLEDASSTALSGALVTLQSSTDGVHFSAVAGQAANVANGTYRVTVAPTSRTYYRFVFAGLGGVGGSTSGIVTVFPHVSVSAPSSKSSISHNSRLAITGTIKPAHATGSRSVQLQVYRWNGHAWTLYARSWTSVVNRGNYSTYSASLKLPKNGYHIYAYALGDAQHAATTSGVKSVSVK